MTTATPQIALSKDFLDAFSRLPKKTQKKVREFMEKFRKDPTQSGINFEKIETAKDPKVRSVRIDQAYRAIVVHPPKGDVYLCVWVDNHDDAYEWAQDKVFEVNPRSGAMQVFDVVQVNKVVAEQPSLQGPIPDTVSAGLFDAHDDEALLFAGVPQPLLASVRALRTEAELDALGPHLPTEASDVLYLLAAGSELIEAIEEAGRSKSAPEKVDTNDFGSAMEQLASQERFKVVSDEAELDAMLDAPLEQWRVFLHPSQRKLVRMNANGPVRVLGGAGTGKTVVLMHRARYLASEVFTGDNDRLLVTTFTRNLALDLRMNLQTLCSAEAFGRLEVTNLHSWAVSFMRRHKFNFKIINNSERRNLFDLALTEAPDDSRSIDFYMDEWNHVVQAQEVQSRDEYLTARRVGRGTRLSKRQRIDVWSVLSRYRELLDADSWVEWPDVIRETRLYIEKQKIPTPYCAVLSDEVQDFSASQLKLLRLLAPAEPNTLFLVGDGHQRIYGQPARLGACGIEIRGRSRRLKLNYRTTQQIRERAVAILEGREFDDLDGGLDTMTGYRSIRSGPQPELSHFKSEADEASFVVSKIQSWVDTGVPAEAICLAARKTAQLADRYGPMLDSSGIEHLRVRTDPESEAAKPGVRLSTMHRMKGLEFSRVILAGVQDGIVPQVPDSDIDELATESQELLERCLLYVACTRARDELVITGFGESSRFLTGGGDA